ncbi:7760_t:CDS:1, partial [Acaulospora colombiana]
MSGETEMQDVVYLKTPDEDKKKAEELDGFVNVQISAEQGSPTEAEHAQHEQTYHDQPETPQDVRDQMNQEYRPNDPSQHGNFEPSVGKLSEENGEPTSTSACVTGESDNLTSANELNNLKDEVHEFDATTGANHRSTSANESTSH